MVNFTKPDFEENFSRKWAPRIRNRAHISQNLSGQKIVQFSRLTPPLHGRSPKMQIRTLFNLPSFTPPVRATVGEVRYSIEIDVGGE